MNELKFSWIDVLFEEFIISEEDILLQHCFYYTIKNFLNFANIRQKINQFDLTEIIKFI